MKKLLMSMIAVSMAMMLMVVPVFASGNNTIVPYLNHAYDISLSLKIEDNDDGSCVLMANLDGSGTGISGIMKLYDPSGACVAMWSVSNYPGNGGFVYESHTYSGATMSGTWKLTFSGYIYGNTSGGTVTPDKLDIESTFKL